MCVVSVWLVSKFIVLSMLHRALSLRDTERAQTAGREYIFKLLLT